jgi:hypothetical protein
MNRRNFKDVLVYFDGMVRGGSQQIYSVLERTFAVHTLVMPIGQHFKPLVNHHSNTRRVFDNKLTLQKLQVLMPVAPLREDLDATLRLLKVYMTYNYQYGS